LAVELPPGLAFSLRPRSGVTRRGIWVAYGSIDTGYRGEIAVELHNLTAFSYAISVGDRIAQLVLARVVDCTWEERETLGATSRGEGGFGGSGK
jgi:dUTP pyrophosphatase